MKRIINKGKIPDKPNVYYLATCEKCQCKFEYDKEDIIQVLAPENISGKYRECDFTDHHVITCPHCGRKFMTVKYDNYSANFDKGWSTVWHWIIFFGGFIAGILFIGMLCDGGN